MLDINNLVQWQKIDPDSGIVFPWWTHPAIDRLCQMRDDQDKPLSDLTVLEFGGGWSTIWLAKHCAHVYTIEANASWATNIRETLVAYNLLHKCTISLREINEGDQTRAAEYLSVPDNCDPDIICVDGILRNNCLELAISLGGPIIVIADNWQQSYVWMSQDAADMMAPYTQEVFEQEDHTDNDGINKWKTAIFYI
jgi:predicted O-methyltransferase YrrM